MNHPFLELILLTVLAAAAVTDLKSFKIPNWLTMSAMMAGVFGHAFLDGFVGVLFSLKGLGLGLALFLFLYVMGGMGAGDVKLLAAVGSFIGPEGVLSAGIMAMLLGGLYAIAMMISHWGVLGALMQMVAIIKTCVLMPKRSRTLASLKTEPQLRYALVIGLGTVVSQWLEVPFFTF
jgi:prepilin peptidase CpaA